MDRSNNGAAGRSLNTDGVKEWDAGGRSSVESQSSKLQKKRSTVGVRNASQPLPPVSGRRQSVFAGNEKQRKGSLRNAVRKIFGRRSKEIEEPPQCSTPRHAYHRSESHALSPQPEEPEPRQDTIPHRTLSAPLQAHPAASSPRVRSPYAVEFPQSARLKPLNLGNPLPTPMSALKRRITLPSLLLNDDQAADLSRSIGLTDAPPIPGLAISGDTTPPDPEPATYGSFNPKRRSRSADDLKGALDSHRPSFPRQRSEEIRYWRGSVQPSILRASGFSSKMPRSEDIQEQQEDKTPTVATANPFEAAPSRPASTAQQPPRQSLLPADASIAAGSELSRDLEDRVAKLEAGLQSFQQSLQRLTTERNRPTVLVGTVPHGRRNSTDARTPSMLADTLSNFDSPAYQYDDPTPDIRPSTSPAPSTPIRSSAPPPFHLPAAAAPDPASHARRRSPSRVIPGSSARPPKIQDYTFRSLYEMLADERSARRNLERQLRGLRAEINDLHYQVSSVHSQRSSFVPSVVDPMVGSSRLQRLLVDAEGPGVVGGRGGAGDGGLGVMSRFSGSESGVGEWESRESLATTGGEYKTPGEGVYEGGEFPLGGGGGGEGVMF
ncbi:hypothetical protein EJ03DRAFT_346749 [Teratosphaeria nubilosa]|uniref:Uncharacterized protein n=1 Tax=Teratosphaeria nubilosa TaxID=161662 RepID=A0A6G1LNH1_9PEZI|nr:hypothetical protein EJ03DRAFT_346749 [Teratosphaeria nubilosa]